MFFSVTYAQETKINYKYNGYVVHISDSQLTVINPKKNLIDTIFNDRDEEYYLTDEEIKISILEMERIKLSNPQKKSSLDYGYAHYVAKTNSSILSIVGPYISYSSEYYYEGGAHPSYGKDYNTYNIETKKTFNLEDFFSEEALYKALIKNEFILNYVNPKKALNLDQLKGEFFMNVEAQYSLDFSSFSFGNIIGGQIKVNIGLSHDAEVYRGGFELISIQLDIPEKLKSILYSSLKADLLDKE